MGGWPRVEQAHGLWLSLFFGQGVRDALANIANPGISSTSFFSAHEVNGLTTWTLGQDNPALRQGS